MDTPSQTESNWINEKIAWTPLISPLTLLIFLPYTGNNSSSKAFYISTSPFSMQRKLKRICSILQNWRVIWYTERIFSILSADAHNFFINQITNSFLYCVIQCKLGICDYLSSQRSAISLWDVCVYISPFFGDASFAIS